LARSAAVANKAHLEVLEKGVTAWNVWRNDNFEIQPNLRGANLSDKNLNGVDLSTAFLSEAKFNRSYLVGANLSGSFLDQVQFDETMLRGTNFGGSITAPIKKDESEEQGRLRWKETQGANLKGATFSRAYLEEVNFSTSYLSGTDFADCMMSGSYFINVDLSECKGLEAVKHDGPSNIDIDTIYRSGGKIPEVFLRGAGVPEPFIANMKSLVAAMQPIEFYSCFISYSSKDKDFAERLYADLQAKNVRCWFAPEDLKIGDRLRPSFDEAIREHDKLMVLLSDNSVTSEWVEKEVETAFEKERRNNRTVLFPIRLDDAVMETEQAWAADIRRTRHIGDFRLWKNHDAYKKAFERLLKDLKA